MANQCNICGGDIGDRFPGNSPSGGMRSNDYQHAGIETCIRWLAEKVRVMDHSRPRLQPGGLAALLREREGKQGE